MTPTETSARWKALARLDDLLAEAEHTMQAAGLRYTDLETHGVLPECLRPTPLQADPTPEEPIGPPPYTFEQFQDTRRAEADISAALKYDDEGHTSGYVYCGCLYIENVDSWDDCAPGKGKGKWYLILGRCEFLSDDLETLERRLYQYAIDEQFPLHPEAVA